MSDCKEGRRKGGVRVLKEALDWIGCTEGRWNFNTVTAQHGRKRECQHRESATRKPISLTASRFGVDSMMFFANIIYIETKRHTTSSKSSCERRYTMHRCACARLPPLRHNTCDCVTLAQLQCTQRTYNAPDQEQHRTAHHGPPWPGRVCNEPACERARPVASGCGGGGGRGWWRWRWLKLWVVSAQYLALPYTRTTLATTPCRHGDCVRDIADGRDRTTLTTSQHCPSAPPSFESDGMQWTETTSFVIHTQCCPRQHQCSTSRGHATGARSSCSVQERGAPLNPAGLRGRRL